MSLPFDGKELNRVNTQILIMIHAFQLAAIDVIIDHLNLLQSEKRPRPMRLRNDIKTYKVEAYSI